MAQKAIGGNVMKIKNVQNVNRTKLKSLMILNMQGVDIIVNVRNMVIV